jgi:hypothetical protein
MFGNRWQGMMLAALVAAGAVGCGDGRVKLSVAPTDGRVVCEGQPVPNVTVFFEPLPDGDNAKTGKSAVGYADGNGAFVLTTYDNNDGAVVGKHRVRVGRPVGANGQGEFKCDCVVNDEVDVMEYQVESGRNSVEIVLKKATKADQVAAAKKPAVNDAEIDD